MTKANSGIAFTRLTWLERAAVGLVTGVSVAVLFSVFAAVVWYIEGRSLERLNTTLGTAVLLYFLWGPPVGVVTGLLFPWTRRRVGAVVVGALVVASAYVIVAVLTGMALAAGLGFLLLGLLAGGIGGRIVFGRVWKELEGEASRV